MSFLFGSGLSWPREMVFWAFPQQVGFAWCWTVLVGSHNHSVSLSGGRRMVPVLSSASDCIFLNHPSVLLVLVVQVIWP